MKKALISPNEVIQNFDNTTGQRVADIHATGFEVAAPLFWVDCEDDVVADRFYYDPTDATIKVVPEFVPPAPIGGEPNVIA
jgi:hypothetical protein